jgi:pyruvate kinase
MIKTITIQTKSLEETGSRAGWFDGNDKANNKTIVDSEKLAQDIEKQISTLIKDGYQILSIMPITSQKIVAHSLQATFTSSVVIIGQKP